MMTSLAEIWFRWKLRFGGFFEDSFAGFKIFGVFENEFFRQFFIYISNF